jgi:hypothetical protein
MKYGTHPVGQHRNFVVRKLIGIHNAPLGKFAGRQNTRSGFHGAPDRQTQLFRAERRKVFGMFQKLTSCTLTTMGAEQVIGAVYCTCSR